MTVAAFVALVGAVQTLYELLKDARKVLQQRGEMTPEAEAAFDAIVKSLQTDATKPPHWKIEP